MFPVYQRYAHIRLEYLYLGNGYLRTITVAYFIRACKQIRTNRSDGAFSDQKCRCVLSPVSSCRCDELATNSSFFWPAHPVVGPYRCRTFSC